ncbi:MAG: endonuclease/exonuclease/phosphatase family protein [Clostridia bacterium]|nr:endonuclease/exonuclease/phosphatase family protein [Clostridia bacterium]
MEHSIKVMSFNMRCRTEADGPNFFDLRREKIAAMLASENPDLIGFQEVTPEMLAWLQEVLDPNYVVLGHGRGKTYDGEANPIAYRKDCFALHAFRTEWLSDTPDVPGSRFENAEQSGCPRIYCCAELLDLQTRKAFAFYNTHTDHKGVRARTLASQLLIDRLGACDIPFVMTGDFNALPDEEAIQLLLATKQTLGTVDATCGIKGTFHNFSMDRIQKGTLSKIDYVFTNLNTDPTLSYAVADDNACGHFYSDHNAVCAFVSAE